MMNKNMLIYIAKKAGQLILSILVLSVLVFCVSRIAPGDPLKAYYGEGVERMSAQQLDNAREQLGLDDPLPVQFGKWLGAAIQGDFGISYQYKQPAEQVISDVIGNTILLTACSFFLIFILGFLLAVYCVRREGKAADRWICKIGVAANSIPEFFVALLLILIFSVTLGLLPQSGSHSLFGGGFFDVLRHLILPVSSIVISHIWYCAYLMRNKLSEELTKDYVLLCMAKGLSDRRIIYGHCLRNVMPSVVSMMAIFLPHLLGGTYVIEIIFSYPGLGRLGLESAKYHDYNLLMIVCLLTGTTVILANMAAQMISEKLDPRIKNQSGRAEQ